MNTIVRTDSPDGARIASLEQSLTRQYDSGLQLVPTHRPPSRQDDNGLQLVPTHRPQSRRPALPNSHYTAAMICPLPLEKAAAMAMLDEEHMPLRTRRKGDDNTYTLGSIHTEQGTHHVVIAGMGRGNIGILPASTVAHHLKETFPQAKLCLVVGIGGGVPSKDHDMRLGDVVVGEKVVSYDPQRRLEDSVVRTRGDLSPPGILLTAVSSLEARHETSASHILPILEERRHRLTGFSRPFLDDLLFHTGCLHTTDETDDYEESTDLHPCHGCDLERVHKRRPRKTLDPKIHIGSIASGGTLLRSSHVRETLGRQTLGGLCFEMETAGIMEVLPCLPIRGIADYADSHKNKKWQRYAASTAAAYARELLEEICPICIDEGQSINIPTEIVAEINQIPLEKRQEHLLDSLRFKRMDQRRQDVDMPQSFTCEWLLQEPHVLDWLDDSKFSEHHGLLWLVGNAGAGKSTCMSFLFDRHKRKSKQSPGSGECLFGSFFFHNRGVELEKTVIGMYRTLLLHLFTGYRDLLGILDDLSFHTVGTTANQCPSIKTLQHLLREALLGLKGRSFVCYVDALDEGDVQDIRNMTEFFQGLATDPGIRQSGSFRVMFSSRPYPDIGPWKGMQFILESSRGHDQDLEEYTRHHLQGAEPIIIDTILKKANGVFLWVKLVAHMFYNDYLAYGRPCDLDRLQNTPTELSDLFKDILLRDRAHWEEFTVAITWILYAGEPLHPQEFFFALETSMEIERQGSCRLSEVKTISWENMKKRVVSATKGLAEVTGDFPDSRVQLIHESAQTFLRSGGLDELLPGSQLGSVTLCNGRLAKYCLETLMAPNTLECVGLTETDLTETDSDSSSDGPGPAQKSSQVVPFMKYLVFWVLVHLNSSEDCRPIGFANKFPAQRWQKMRGSLVGSRKWPVLHECSERNYVSLLKDVDWFEQCCGTDLNAQDGDGETPLLIGADWGNLDVVHILVEKGANLDLSRRDGTTPLMRAVDESHTEIAEFLIASGANIHAEDDEKGTALHFAAKRDLLSVIALLIRQGAKIDKQDKHGYTPLMEAARYNRQSSTKMLLNAGADLEKLDRDVHRTALAIAAILGDVQLCECLLAAGAHIEAREEFGRTPLLLAAARRKSAVVQFLVKHGADVNASNDNETTVLMYAVVFCTADAVKCLLEGGADPHARDNGGKTAMDWAESKSREDVCDLLRHWMIEYATE